MGAALGGDLDRAPPLPLLAGREEGIMGLISSKEVFTGSE